MPLPQVWVLFTLRTQMASPFSFGLWFWRMQYPPQPVNLPGVPFGGVFLAEGVSQSETNVTVKVLLILFAVYKHRKKSFQILPLP
jgi:hypothetical protein